MKSGEEDECFEQNVYINPEDGMPNTHPNLVNLNDSYDILDDVENDDDLPKSVIVTNISFDIFNNEKFKKELEDLFCSISDVVSFQWLKSFRRLRVNYDNALAAMNARIQLHQYTFHDSPINCYFAQPVTPVPMKHLHPPAPTKQFLISPPSSPPIGWEPREENEPLINHDLLAALANLSPGESHELHAPTETQPAIIVHTALPQDPNSMLSKTSHIPHTRCPQH